MWLKVFENMALKWRKQAETAENCKMRSFLICTSQHTFLGDRIKKDEMRRSVQHVWREVKYSTYTFSVLKLGVYMG